MSNLKFMDDHELFKFILTHDYNSSTPDDTIKRYRSTVWEEYQKIVNERKRVEEAAEVLKKHELRIDDWDKYKQIIEELKLEESSFTFNLNLIDKYIKEKQEVCKHKWDYTGHDSHYDFYECKLCGMTDKW